MNILEVPAEILYVIFTDIDVNDFLALRMTCKSLRAMFRDRSVWYEALSTRFQHRNMPIPGLRQRSLYELSTEELEQLTIRAYRFWSNWTSPQPRWHAHINIRDAKRDYQWVAETGSCNLALEFLPGRGNRYLLTLTLCDATNAADRRRYAFECWDVSLEEPKLVATLRTSGLLGYAINSMPGSEHVLAVNRRDARNQLVITTYTLDNTYPNINPWFRRTSEFDSFRHTLGLDGSYFVTTDADQGVRIIKVENGRLLCTLNVPSTHADPTLRFHEHDCIEYEILNDFMLTFCKQWIYLYHLPQLTNDHVDPAPTLYPVAKYKWPWRIDTISVNSRRHARSYHPGTHTRPGTLPIIDILIRFDTWYPWPVNMLHHFVLHPNAAYLAHDPASPCVPPLATTLPYLASPSTPDVPVLVHPIASPVRLFVPSDMVLGPRSTALWLEALADATTPAQAGDRGQCIALKVLAETSLGALAGADVNAETDLTEMRLGDPATGLLHDSDSSGSATQARAKVSVLLVRETDELWNRVAVNEEEGLVAVGHVDGNVSVYSYAPP